MSSIILHYFKIFQNVDFLTAQTTGPKARKKRRLFSLRYIEGTRTNRMILNAKKGTAAGYRQTRTKTPKGKEYHASLASVETSTDTNEGRQDTKREHATTDIHNYGKAEKRTTGKARTKERHQRRQERHQTTTGTKSRET